MPFHISLAGLLGEAKVSCMYCGNKIPKNTDFCPKCGRDLRCAQTAAETPSVPEPRYCPKDTCHALYTEGEVLCVQCKNDFSKHPPILRSQFAALSVTGGPAVYCPECGRKNEDPAELFCACGCDFRRSPRVETPPDGFPADEAPAELTGPVSPPEPRREPPVRGMGTGFHMVR